MRGALSIGKLHLHWSLALGALPFCAPRFSPLLLGAFAAVVAAHTLGHLAAILACGLRPGALELHGLGGEFTAGRAQAGGARQPHGPSPVESSVIAWGGVLAQGALIVAALLAPLPHDLGIALVRLNGVALALNLLPVAPLDGAEAWRLFGRLRRRPHRAVLPDPLRVQHDVQELLKKLRKPVQ